MSFSCPERRLIDRTRPPTPRVIGRARVSATYPHIRTAPVPRGRWFPVVDGNPAVHHPALQGYIWIDVYGRLQHVRAAHFEIEEAAGDARAAGVGGVRSNAH